MLSPAIYLVPLHLSVSVLPFFFHYKVCFHRDIFPLLTGAGRPSQAVYIYGYLCTDLLWAVVYAGLAPFQDRDLLTNAAVFWSVSGHAFGVVGIEPTKETY